MHGVASAPMEAPREEEPSGEQHALVGQQLGEYRVKRCIGQGGMGFVYEAEHVTLGRKVALKLLREEHARSPYARNLLSEARAASAIQHRGIIDVFGFGQQPGIGQYLVMEYLEGQPLSEFMAEHAPLPPAEVIQLLGEVLDALSAAHAQGVIHRDLKPNNIFIVQEQDGSRYVKVLDFGLAKRTSPDDGLASRSEIVVGTPNYMAPEQALNEAVGPRTDLYAVGVIAFEMLTRRRLFAGRSNFEMVAHHLKSPPPRPSFYVEVPPALDTLILRLLAKEPHQRPATASEVACEMRALLSPSDGSPSPAAPAPLSQAKYSPAFSFMVEPTQQPVELEPALPTPHTLPALPPAPARSVRWPHGVAVAAVLALLVAGSVMIGRASPATAPPEEAPVVSAQPPSMAAPTSLAEPRPEPASHPARVEPPLTKKTSALAPALVRATSPAKHVLAAAKKPPAPAEPKPAPAMAPPPSTPAPAAEPSGTPGTLHITVKGAWADVWVDGKMLGRVPPLHRYTLSAGEHVLELRNPGLPPLSDTILITSGETLPYTRTLQPMTPPPSSP